MKYLPSTICCSDFVAVHFFGMKRHRFGGMTQMILGQKTHIFCEKAQVYHL